MTYFKAKSQSLINSLVLPDGEYLLGVIFENNQRVTDVSKLFFDELLVIECENKPRNMPMFGVFCEEFQP